MTNIDDVFAAMPDTQAITVDDSVDFVIDSNLRVISIPTRGVVLGVEGDKDVNRVTFLMPKIYKGVDLSQFDIRVNYANANGEKNFFKVTETSVTDDQIRFVWVVGADAVAYVGYVEFVVRFIKILGSNIIQEFNTTLTTARSLVGLSVDGEITTVQQNDLLAHFYTELDTYSKRIKNDIISSVPADYRVLTDNVSEINNDIAEMKTVEKNIQTEINKIKTDGVKGNLDKNDVKNAVDTYLESNTLNGIFTPNNLVLYEEVDDSDSTQITPSDIIAEVISQLELKSIGGYMLGLYMGSTLIDSIQLDEFRASDIICTGLSVNPKEVTAYGKAIIELIASATPVNCTQKVRWFTGDETMATVENGTVKTTGISGNVSITAVCGNYQAVVTITVSQYVYNDFDWQIGLISDTVGGPYNRYGDSQNMRISSAYIATPVDTEIIMTGGDPYRYTIYYYKDGKLTAPCAGWAICSTTVTIKADEYDGFAIKIMRKSYARWDDTYIEAFSKTISIRSA